MNYTQLSNAIQAYTENTEADFVANVPVFVTQAEQRIYNSMQFPSIRKNVTGLVSPSTIRNNTGGKRNRCRFQSIKAHAEQERSEFSRIGNHKGH